MKKVGIPILILVVAIAVFIALIMAKQKPEKKEQEIEQFLVDASPIEFENIDFLVFAQGSVQPKNRTTLSTQVSGKVEFISEQFVEGGFFKKGDILVELESADYQTDLLLAEAELARANAALEEEIARGQVAEREWRSVNTGTAPQLGLRKPQLAREKANLLAAEAQLDRALRNLERTKIKAPFDGLVKDRGIDIGQFVPLGGQVGEVFSTNVAEVRLPLTDSDAAFIGSIKQRQPTVTLRATVAGETRFWQGRLVRDEAILDESRRVIYGVVEVEDPYNLNGQQHAVPLRFGRFVKAEVAGISVEQVVKLPREVGRLDGTVLTVDDNQVLHINDVEVVRSDEEYLYVSAGINPSHQVITSAVPNPFEGMKVKVIEDSVAPSMSETQDNEGNL